MGINCLYFCFLIQDLDLEIKLDKMEHWLEKRFLLATKGRNYVVKQGDTHIHHVVIVTGDRTMAASQCRH